LQRAHQQHRRQRPFRPGRRRRRDAGAGKRLLNRQHRVIETLEYLQLFARFPLALHRFLRHTVTLDEARRTVRARMPTRDARFLHIVERGVYAYPRSPYLQLLRHAGCEMGDLRALVEARGLDAALHHLREQGVYVTFEELRGRKPLVRSGLTLAVTPRDFDNPLVRRDFAITTGGSGGL